MNEQDQKLWEEIQRNPAEAVGFIRNSMEFFVEGYVEPRSADYPFINRLLNAEDKKPIGTPDLG